MLTWFVVTGGVGEPKNPFAGRWEDFRKLREAGHDVQSHTVSHHQNDAERPDDEVRAEYRDSQQAIATNVAGSRPVCLSYPCGSGKPDIAAEYYVACRGVHGSPNAANRINYLSTGCCSLRPQSVDMILTGQHATVARLNDPRNRRAWLTPVYHYVRAGGTPAEKDATQASVAEELAYLASKQEQIWVGLFREVACYGMERDTSRIQVTKNTGEEIRFLLSDDMDDTLFDYPLTIKVRLPRTWSSAAARQGGKSVAARLVEHDGGRFALVQVVPDRGEVTIVEHDSQTVGAKRRMVKAEATAAAYPLTPHLAGPWWTIARDPDLGALTSPKQQPVDFAIWQAADGTWQLWSCIRGTKEPGKTRLFHRWEGAKLTDRDWAPKGIALQADSALGETQGGLQAPYVLRHDGKFWMFYGDWANICLATSMDGKGFTRQRNSTGKPQLNFAGPVDRDRNGRDPMVVRVGDKWHCYYTAHPGNKGFDYARTSDDLINWSDERVVAAGGQAGNGPYSAECPFVVEPQPGHYYLFRTQAYGQNAQTRVYHSRNPLDFGIDNDAEHYVTTVPVAAPEVFRHENQWYLAALLPSLKGIQITRLAWAPVW